MNDFQLDTHTRYLSGLGNLGTSSSEPLSYSASIAGGLAEFSQRSLSMLWVGKIGDNSSEQILKLGKV